MIEKWYCIRCDNCGEVINYWQTYSSMRALEKEKEDGDSGVIVTPSKQFCDVKCQKEWSAKRRQAKKNQKKMDKVMEKFLGGKNETKN